MNAREESPTKGAKAQGKRKKTTQKWESATLPSEVSSQNAGCKGGSRNAGNMYSTGYPNEDNCDETTCQRGYAEIDANVE